jgi:hypothetical protein
MQSLDQSNQIDSELVVNFAKQYIRKPGFDPHVVDSVLDMLTATINEKVDKQNDSVLNNSFDTAKSDYFDDVIKPVKLTIDTEIDKRSPVYRMPDSYVNSCELEENINF